jgi:hypothetical protein
MKNQLPSTQTLLRGKIPWKLDENKISAPERECELDVNDRKRERKKLRECCVTVLPLRHIALQTTNRPTTRQRSERSVFVAVAVCARFSEAAARGDSRSTSFSFAMSSRRVVALGDRRFDETDSHVW